MSPVSGEGNNDKYPVSEPEDAPFNENEIWEENSDQSDGSDSSGRDHQGGADPALPWETNLRLPRSVIPVHYDLYLFPDLDNGMFSGKRDCLNAPTMCTFNK